MPCDKWNEEWIAALYDEIDPAEQAKMQAHVDACADCRSLVDELKRSRSLLREAAPDVPAAPRVLVLGPTKSWWHRPAWSFAAGAACVGVMFALGLWVGSAQPAETDGQELLAHFQELEQRVAAVESRPDSDTSLSRVQFQSEIDRLQRQLEQQRASDLRYVMETVIDSELRTGNWLDRTEQALTYLALRQDPRISER